MAFLIDEAYLPATLTAPPMTDEQFAEFVSEHPDLNFEMTAEGELIVMPPTFSVTGFRNQEIGRQFANWAVRVTGESRAIHRSASYCRTALDDRPISRGSREPILRG